MSTVVLSVRASRKKPPGLTGIGRNGASNPSGKRQGITLSSKKSREDLAEKGAFVLCMGQPHSNILSDNR